MKNSNAEFSQNTANPASRQRGSSITTDIQRHGSALCLIVLLLTFSSNEVCTILLELFLCNVAFVMLFILDVREPEETEVFQCVAR